MSLPRRRRPSKKGRARSLRHIRFAREGGVRAPLPLRLARRAVSETLRSAGRREPLDVNVVWVSAPRIRALNRRFRSTDRGTDVISFRYDADKEFPSPAVSGDLFVCVGRARYNARRFHVSVEEEAVRLLVHGTLHLLGFTDYVPVEKKKMWRRQEGIVRRLGFGDAFPQI
ncbi:MAG TPA: rRNA maturation RNase YbeY [Elusimicrobiota bacterium]|nr:rRNA maturation RNase YbeY [Elusimicrobiota bacterium]